MPIQTAYPGVYVDELPGGPRAIAPVPTSIAAFVGRAPFGPTDLPLTIYNYGDFKRYYGGLTADCPMSYAVQDFFDNGGSQAVVARLFEPAEEGSDGFARLAFPSEPGGSQPSLALRASSPGEWGNGLEARTDRDGIDDKTAGQFEVYGLEAADLFNLTLTRLDDGGRRSRPSASSTWRSSRSARRPAFPTGSTGSSRNRSLRESTPFRTGRPPTARRRRGRAAMTAAI